MDKKTRQPRIKVWPEKGCASVTYEDPSAASAAISWLLLIIASKRMIVKKKAYNCFVCKPPQPACEQINLVPSTLVEEYFSKDK